MKGFRRIICAALLLGVCFFLFRTPLQEAVEKAETLGDRGRTEAQQTTLAGETEGPGEATGTPDDTGTAAPAGEGTFYYDQLTAQEQTAYRDILEGMEAFEASYPIRITSKDPVGRLFDAVILDHPEVFWVNGYTVTENTWAGMVVSVILEPEYNMDRETAEAYRARVEEKAAQVLAPLSGQLSDYAKVQYLYKYIINETSYHAEADNSQNICSVLLEGTSVCMGYARAFQYLADRLGLTSTTVTGYAGGQNHAWNLVQMDGDWYYVDTTWGDPSFQEEDSVSNNLNYAFLGITTEKLMQTHTPDEAFSYPACTAVKDNYYVQEGLLFDGYDREEVGAVIGEYARDGREFISFAFRTEEAFEQAVEDLFQETHVFDYVEADGHLSYRDEALYRTVTVYFNNNETSAQ